MRVARVLSKRVSPDQMASYDPVLSTLNARPTPRSDHLKFPPRPKARIMTSPRNPTASEDEGDLRVPTPSLTTNRTTASEESQRQHIHGCSSKLEACKMASQGSDYNDTGAAGQEAGNKVKCVHEPALIISSWAGS